MTTLNDVFSDKRSAATPAVYSALEDRAAIKARTENVRRSGVNLPASMLLKRALGRLDALLDIDIKAILVGAWSRTREIRDYGERSRKEPTKEFLVSLAEHVVRSQHRPYLEIVINGNPDGRITFDVDAKLKLEGFQLVIRDGRILAVTTGSCEGSGEARLEGIIIMEQTGRRIQLPGRLDLGDGIVIA